MRSASKPHFFSPLKDCDLREAGLRMVENREAILWYCDTRDGRVVRDQPYAPDLACYAWRRSVHGVQVQGIQLSFEEASTFVTISHTLTQSAPPARAGPTPYYDYRILTLLRPGSYEGFETIHPAIVAATKDYLLRHTRPYERAPVAEPEHHGEHRFSHITSGRAYRAYQRRSDLDPPHPVYELFDHLINIAMSGSRF